VIKVFVADDHAVVREGLARILDAVADMEYAGSAETARDVLRLAPSADWDVLILDLSGLGGEGGAEVLDQLRVLRPKLPTIIYSMYPEEQYGVRMLQAGAMAYLSKGRSTEHLLEAIRRAVRGLRTITDPVATRMFSAGNKETDGLTSRELQILQLVAEGKQTSTIAAALCITPSTVSTHLKRIKEKLVVETQAELVGYAFRNGLVQ
jgi:two-component system, NarL family, invasion response regulator UvrY